MTIRLQNSIRSASLALGLICASLLVAPNAMAGDRDRDHDRDRDEDFSHDRKGHHGHGHDRNSIAPPNSQPYGQSMAEWLADFTRWKAAGFPVDNRCGKVLFLPPLADDQPAGAGTLEDPLIFTAHGDMTIEAGTPLLDVLIAWYGELYPDGSVDPAMPKKFWGTYVTGEINLNDRTIFDEVKGHYISPVKFRPALLYPEPTPWGAIGTAFVQGVPVMLKPLPVGVHTYETIAYVLIPAGNGVTPETAVIFHTTRTITVVR